MDARGTQTLRSGKAALGKKPAFSSTARRTESFGERAATSAAEAQAPCPAYFSSPHLFALAANAAASSVPAPGRSNADEAHYATAAHVEPTLRAGAAGRGQRLPPRAKTSEDPAFGSRAQRFGRLPNEDIPAATAYTPARGSGPLQGQSNMRARRRLFCPGPVAPSVLSIVLASCCFLLSPPSLPFSLSPPPPLSTQQTRRCERPRRPFIRLDSDRQWLRRTKRISLRPTRTPSISRSPALAGALHLAKGTCFAVDCGSWGLCAAQVLRKLNTLDDSQCRCIAGKEIASATAAPAMAPRRLLTRCHLQLGTAHTGCADGQLKSKKSDSERKQPRVLFAAGVSSFSSFLHIRRCPSSPLPIAPLLQATHNVTLAGKQPQRDSTSRGNMYKATSDVKPIALHARTALATADRG